MKKFPIVAATFLLMVAFSAAIDYPYLCTESETCGDDCDPGVAFCNISATLPYPTQCDNIVEEGRSVRCIAKKTDGSGMVVADSGVQKCLGCGSSGIGDGCEPGSGAWWVGCDPFAY